MDSGREKQKIIHQLNELEDRLREEISKRELTEKKLDEIVEDIFGRIEVKGDCPSVACGCRICNKTFWNNVAMSLPPSR